MPAATPNGRSRAGAKNSSNSLMVILKLSGDALQQFASPKIKSSQNNTPNMKTNDSSPASSAELPTVRPSSADNGSDADANSTPTGATPSDAQRRKGVPGPKPGNKRTKEQTDATAKSRGRPGPKKKPRLDEGDTTKIPAAQRLGPKANTGAINAGLRALDRTGAACRKWERKPLQLRSFTGIVWQLPSWRTPGMSKSEDLIDGKSTAVESGDSDSKPMLHVPGTDTANGSSAVPSEKSNSGDGDVTPAPSHLVEPSSPAIAMTA
ncbi:INO80 complex subunit Ies4 [Penicillium coprophilum]|uniref:INO80 complex subunit Ies4 n=1 Tax=Penicillium coprophilum TaxID=36646 RepID=UPI0023A547CE|nr:INO80 complex subunit Ies4 [Penicillium coprophilum]KAJ5177424.1 INO80 complex subunit Ies4 [Penicillium coprophilum]